MALSVRPHSTVDATEYAQLFLRTPLLLENASSMGLVLDLRWGVLGDRSQPVTLARAALERLSHFSLHVTYMFQLLLRSLLLVEPVLGPDDVLVECADPGRSTLQ